MRIRLAYFLLPLLAAEAMAHPVAFKGAWGIMAYHQPDAINWQLAYSATSRLAFGADYLRDAMSGPERHFGYGRLNLLLKRWNGDDYQANVYAYGGAGAAIEPGATRLAALAGGEADYETRKIYFSAKAMALFVRDGDDMVAYAARAGIAPYVGEAGDLHTWLIAQALYYPSATSEPVRVGPVLRFFYHNVLWELGVSVRGTWSFNFMVHL